MSDITQRLAGFVKGLGTRFQYDALIHKGRRRNPGIRNIREDGHISGTKRGALQANARDLARNMSLASWMVRRHLDYVSQFSFHSRTDNEALDTQIETLMEEDGRPQNADVAGKFSREKLFRLAELCRVLDGDTFLVKLDDGRLQGIQADLITDPKDPLPDEQWINGVLITGVGRPLSYGVKIRQGYDSEKFDRRINSTNVIHYGFFNQYAADQVRGVSPLVSSLNSLRDTYEGFDYALAKMKVSQYLALIFYRDAVESVGDVLVEGEESQDDSGQSTEPRYRVDFGRGPVMLDLDAGDKAEILESKTPSQEFQSFMTQVIQVSLKALDIPFSFYDESHTNFFGSRAAWLHYERSCRDKRDDQIEMRRNYTIWKMQTWIRDGRLILPRGMSIGDLYWEWQPRGMPWWDPAKEVAGNVAAIGAGLDTPQRVCKAADTDFYDNVNEIAKAMEYCRQKGVPINFFGSQVDPMAVEDSQDPVDQTNGENT